MGPGLPSNFKILSGQSDQGMFFAHKCPAQPTVMARYGIFLTSCQSCLGSGSGLHGILSHFVQIGPQLLGLKSTFFVWIGTRPFLLLPGVLLSYNSFFLGHKEHHYT